jgi:E3 ubiquitin-protein ligase HUWE1
MIILCCPGVEDAPEANRKFRQLVTLHLHVHLLAQVYSTAGYAHGRSTNTLLQIVSSADGTDLIADLGVLYGTFLWEAIILKGPDPFKKISGVGSDISLASPTRVNGSDESAVQGILSEGSSSLPKASSTVESASVIKGQNAKAVKAIVQNLSRVTTPFFQGTFNSLRSVGGVLNSVLFG